MITIIKLSRVTITISLAITAHELFSSPLSIRIFIVYVRSGIDINYVYTLDGAKRERELKKKEQQKKNKYIFMCLRSERKLKKK